MSKENDLSKLMQRIEGLSHSPLEEAVNKVQGDHSIEDPNYASNPLEGVSHSATSAEKPTVGQVVKNSFAEVAQTRAERRQEARAQYQKEHNLSKRDLEQVRSEKPINYFDHNTGSGYVPYEAPKVDSTVYVNPNMNSVIGPTPKVDHTDVPVSSGVNPNAIAYAPNALDTMLRAGGSVASAIHGQGDVNHNPNMQPTSSSLGIYEKAPADQMTAPYTPSYQDLDAAKVIGDTVNLNWHVDEEKHATMSVDSVETAPTYAVDDAFKTFWNSIDGLTPQQRADKQMLRAQYFGNPYSPAFNTVIDGEEVLVQYFDKGRIEKHKDGSITVGLLPVELIDKGVNIFIGGDNGTQALTYAELKNISSVTPAGENRTTDQTDQEITALYEHGSKIQQNAHHGKDGPIYNVKFFPETFHNVAEVFIGSFGATESGLEELNAAAKKLVDTAGYPISEAFWTTMTISGKPQEVLVQAFQRRILTYIPGEPNPDYKVQWSNVGQHYKNWKDGQGAPPTATPPVVVPTPTEVVQPPTPEPVGNEGKTPINIPFTDGSFTENDKQSNLDFEGLNLPVIGQMFEKIADNKGKTGGMRHPNINILPSGTTLATATNGEYKGLHVYEMTIPIDSSRIVRIHITGYDGSGNGYMQADDEQLLYDAIYKNNFYGNGFENGRKFFSAQLLRQILVYYGDDSNINSILGNDLKKYLGESDAQGNLTFDKVPWLVSLKNH